jgi:tetratricopeptide (TPR) repeat protein
MIAKNKTRVVHATRFGEALVRLGRIDEAQLVLEQAVRVAPKFARAHYAMGVLHESAGRQGEAAERFATAVRFAGMTKMRDKIEAAHDTRNHGVIEDSMGSPLSPHIPLAGDDNDLHSEFGYLLALGNVRSEQGRYAAAGKVFELAIALRPRQAEVWVALGTVRLKQSDQERATSAFQTALQCDPKSADANFGLGVALQQGASNANDREVAMRYIKRSVDLNPLHASALARLASDCSARQHARSVISLQAAVDAGDGVKGEQSQAGAMIGLASFLDNHGILLFRCQHLLECAVNIEYDRPDAHLLLGRIFHKLALKVGPGDPVDSGSSSSNSPAWINADNANFHVKATRSLRTAIRLDPRNVDALVTLGVALLAAQEDNAGSIVHGNTHVVATTQQILAHDITGKIHKTVEHSRGLLVKPLDVFKAALDLAPERNDLFVGLAQAHEMEGGWFNATKCWQRALATSPDVAEWQLGLGVAAWRSGDIFASAQALYQAMLLGSSAADSFFLSNIVATRARRLIIRVLHGNIGSIVTPSKESGLYPRETLVRLRKIVEEFILRLELRFEESFRSSASSSAPLRISPDGHPESWLKAGDVTSNALEQEGCILVELRPLYIILGHLYLFPGVGVEPEGSDAAQNYERKQQTTANEHYARTPLVMAEELAQASSAFRKGATFATNKTVHHFAVTGALAQLYEMAATVKTNIIEGHILGIALSPEDATNIAAAFYRRALCGVLTFSSNNCSGNLFPLNNIKSSEASITICNDSSFSGCDLSNLVIGLNRTSGHKLQRKEVVTPSAAQLLLRTFFSLPGHPLMPNFSYSKAHSSFPPKTKYFVNNSHTEELHGILATYFKDTAAGRAALRSEGIMACLHAAAMDPTIPGPWVTLGATVASAVEMKELDLLESSSNESLIHWASEQCASKWRDSTRFFIGSNSGGSLVLPDNVVKLLLLLGLVAQRHLTTLQLNSAEDEGRAWLWAGAFAEALGFLRDARSHYESAREGIPASPVPAIRLAVVLEVAAQKDVAKSRKNSEHVVSGSIDDDTNIRSSAVSAREIADKVLRDAVAEDAATANSFEASATLQEALNMLQTGNLSGATAGFLEVAMRKCASSMTASRSLAAHRSKHEVIGTATIGLIDAVVASISHSMQLPSSAESSCVGDKKRIHVGAALYEAPLTPETKAAPTSYNAFDTAYGDDEYMVIFETSSPLQALEEMLKVVGDSAWRRSAITRLCQATGKIAAEVVRENAATIAQATSSSTTVSASKAVWNASTNRIRNAHTSGSLRDLAVPLAVFSVVLRAIPNVSAALSALQSLCILAKDLAIIADRVSDAVIVLRITLGYLVCTAPDAIMGITGLNRDAISHKSLHKGPAWVINCHGDAWTLALGILTSIAQHSTDRGLHDEAMGIFSVVLEYEPMHRPALDGITAIAHSWNTGADDALRTLDDNDEERMDMDGSTEGEEIAYNITRSTRLPGSTIGAVDALRSRPVAALRSVLMFDHSHLGAWMGLTSVASNLTQQYHRLMERKAPEGGGATSSADPSGHEFIRLMVSWSAGDTSALVGVCQYAEELIANATTDDDQHGLANDNLEAAQALLECILSLYPLHPTALNSLAVLGSCLVDGANAENLYPRDGKNGEIKGEQSTNGGGGATLPLSVKHPKGLKLIEQAATGSITAMTNSPWEVRPVATFASQQLARYYGETGQKLLISSGEGRTFAAVVALRIAVSYKVWLFGAPGDISEEDKHRTG